MENTNPLLEAFNQAAYKLGGHGNRDIQVLKEALARMDDNMVADMYGKGAIIEDFQRKMALLLGKESAVFFPSGTMAQQIALRIWCDERGLKQVAYHPLSHLEIHEERGLHELHHIEPVLLGDKEQVITLEDVKRIDRPIACLLLELPQREIGGQLPAFEELEAISAYCKEQGIKLHLDGARLLEILPFYQKSAEEICALFDSVYMSFYKGIGGVAGAILAGDTAFTEQSKVWKRRHGGDLIHLYPYILSADYYYEHRAGKMAQYYEEAQELARYVNACGERIKTVPSVPVSNMFHVHMAATVEQMTPILAEVCERTGVGLTSYVRVRGEAESYFELSLGDRYEAIPKVKLEEAFALLGEKLKTL
ncbi:threonine aldolase [Paenibacillus phyllosphaerae]|uniref:Threonine aldolase n=1 Tax=Paenibacillus phyllosphaerae TaxID=274593 RepID=A0A7W5B3T6_9BACL|nr:beta-eliminating lyase-related protein [Paenibacillus phyllosphaerae]MBB3113910.1 threonine aldolase [Paenibacillus phyllosphaerae]